jgi:tetratricopeptide (TPR) repeat protein
MTKEETVESKLHNSLEHYKERLKPWEDELNPTKEQILEVLLARDALKSALAEPGVFGSADWDKVNELDEQLKAQVEKVFPVSNLPHWQTLVKDKNKDEDWWWFLPQQGKQDWILNALTVTFLTISLGLVTNLGPRFWSGGPDLLISFSIAGQSVLSLLAAGGVLTKTGREGVERLLTRWKQPKQSWQRYLCGVSFGLMVAPIGVYLLLPVIANSYTQQGKRDYKTGQWVSAKRNLERAISVHPDQAEAHLERGKLHEDVQEMDKAKSEYRIAMQAGNAEAFNSLARLSILDKDNKVDAVTSLLKQGEVMSKVQNKEESKEFQYALQRNRGWVRLDQKRYDDAKTALLQAQKLMPEQAAAHCLLAQVLNKQNEPPKLTQEEKLDLISWGQKLKKIPNKLQKGEQQAWQACQKYARSTVPEEDVWIDQSKKCLEPKTRDKCLDLDKSRPSYVE